MLLLYSTLGLLIYFFLVKPYFYWRKRNVRSGFIFPLFGECFYLVFGMESMMDMVIRIYNKVPNVRFHGSFQFTTPMFIVKSPDLFKLICVKDFKHFENHPAVFPEDEEVFSNTLMQLKDESWKNVRSTINPSFSLSKIKSMFKLISQNADTFAKYFMNKNEDIVEVEFRDAFTRYANDVIASTSFGIEVDSLTNRNNDFFLLATEMTDFSSNWKRFVLFMFQMSPALTKFLGLKLFGDKATSFFMNLVKDTIKYREVNNIRRSDMLGVLLDAKKGLRRNENVQDKAKDAEFVAVEEHLNDKGLKHDLSDAVIASQVFIFLFGGFDTVAKASCFMAHELAANPDVQARLIAEVEENIQAHGPPTYESIANMAYLDMVVCETLRKWPVNISTDRIVNKPYTIHPEEPGEKIVHLEVNDVIMLPIVAIHHDPKYYSNPEKFNPERFSPENRKNIDPYTYIPFGVGPRNCIASRFALLEMKAVFFHILSHFEIVPVEKTSIPIRLSKTNMFLDSENGYHLGLKRRQTS